VEELAECAPTLRLLSGVVTFSPWRVLTAVSSSLAQKCPRTEGVQFCITLSSNANCLPGMHFMQCWRQHLVCTVDVEDAKMHLHTLLHSVGLSLSSLSATTIVWIRRKSPSSYFFKRF
jgi:hypothetical protein